MNALPTEMLLSILEEVNFESLLTCQLVSRQFECLINENWKRMRKCHLSQITFHAVEGGALGVVFRRPIEGIPFRFSRKTFLLKPQTDTTPSVEEVPADAELLMSLFQKPWEVKEEMSAYFAGDYLRQAQDYDHVFTVTNEDPSLHTFLANLFDNISVTVLNVIEVSSFWLTQIVSALKTEPIVVRNLDVALSQATEAHEADLDLVAALLGCVAPIKLDFSVPPTVSKAMLRDKFYSRLSLQKGLIASVELQSHYYDFKKHDIRSVPAVPAWPSIFAETFRCTIDEAVDIVEDWHRKELYIDSHLFGLDQNVDFEMAPEIFAAKLNEKRLKLNVEVDLPSLSVRIEDNLRILVVDFAAYCIRFTEGF